MFKGVLLGFACYAAYSISDAFVKLLEGTLPAYEVVFFGALLMLVALPFLKKPDDRWREVVMARKPAIWLLRAFCGGITCYSAQSKSRLLGVPADLIERWGVVSEACAVALAENGRGLLDADFALRVTGVAGPEEQEGKPVGLVYIGLAERDRPTVVEEHRFSGIRSAIQRRSVNTALLMLFRRLRDGE